MPRRLMAVALTVGFLLLQTTAPAAAHGRYKSSIPKKSEVLSAAPASVEIVFSQQLQKVAGTYGIEVTDTSGASVTAAGAVLDEADRSRMTVALAPGLAQGRYVVRWRNVSDEDADPAEGAFAFYVGAEPTRADVDADRALANVGREDVTPAAAPTMASPGGDDSGDDDDDTTRFFIGGAVLAAAIASVVGVIVVRRRRA